MFQLEKINNEKVKPIKLEKVEQSKVKGGCLFDLYSNIFICAKKKSGKTSLISTIIKKCSDKHSRFVIFASTVDSDPTWIHIVKSLKKRGNEVQTYTSIKEQKVDLLQDILNELKEQAQQKRIEEEERENKKQEGCECKKPLSVFDDEEEEEEKEHKQRKPKKLAPEIFFILDDLGQQLRYPSVSQLLKTHRHYKSTCLLSSQYVHDLSVEARKQIDYFIAFKGHSLDKMEIIYKDLDLSVLDFEDFMKIYHDATEKPFSFLFVNVRTEEMRRNLMYKYNIKK